ncbi:deoxyribodipyrimidine photo-lyase [Thiosulfatimonas sediminis]|uniref:Deoxyribodipyrimidine photo-lyase n=1 Tax=Thiosulfatimonas sediminis TaxID=2675054 RepID=A0A6F8PXM0_9GAMM|nr:deoxyribodipyrimidine photo-lyase [Thiosulfatimonas sediminis]BBP46787.1 deoxyribodipyrimidine photo-lyase [Thiosulfatimonas sediminis]
MAKTTLVWLQRELRLSHFPALEKAIAHSERVALVYFHDPKHSIGDANSIWLAQALQSLKNQMRSKKADLLIFSGDFATCFADALQQVQAQQVFYSFQVGEPFASLQNQALNICQAQKIALQPFFSEFWFDPGVVLNQQKNPYVVFTPFYKAALSKLALLEPFNETVTHQPDDWQKLAWPQLRAQGLDKIPEDLLQLQAQSWAQKILKYWTVSEQGAWEKLDFFIRHNLQDYTEDRDFPAIEATSVLSPYLHFGQISSRAIYFELLARSESEPALNYQPWVRQLLWREFARLLMWFFPYTEKTPFQEKFNAMPWQSDAEFIRAWQQGQTGIPIIDAGMRQLWETGYMHNRVRMVVASLLTKDLNQSWLHGLQWFADTLVDADPANNTMGWQWVAGCGVDAAPYYRLFNPLRQSERFDAEGDYIRQWVPEIKALSKKAIHAPWLHQAECRMKGIELGRDYPLPVVDLSESRSQHLQRVEHLKQV